MNHLQAGPQEDQMPKPGPPPPSPQPNPGGPLLVTFGSGVLHLMPMHHRSESGAPGSSRHTTSRSTLLSLFDINLPACHQSFCNILRAQRCFPGRHQSPPVTTSPLQRPFMGVCCAHLALRDAPRAAYVRGPGTPNRLADVRAL